MYGNRSKKVIKWIMIVAAVIIAASMVLTFSFSGI